MHVASGNKLSESYFRIDQATGKVSTQVVLDRDNPLFYEKHTFEVYCEDKKYHRQTLQPATLEITVIDVNDNAPEFSQNSYNFQLTEGQNYGVLVGQVIAQDKDQTQNSLQYTIFDAKRKSENSQNTKKSNYEKISVKKTPFVIDRDGVVSVNTPEILDREEFNFYKFSVKAEDSGDKFTIVPVTVEILDINDNQPKWEKLKYVADISESSKIGLKIAKIKASDKDINENGEIEYSILTGNKHNKFSLNKRTGVLTLKNELDHETSKRYELHITAKDHGKIPKSNSKARILINVIDENDHIPKFLQSNYYRSVYENRELGSSLVRVRAVDQDSGSNGIVKYKLRMDKMVVYGPKGKEIENYNLGRFPFELDSKTGDLKLVRMLNREVISKYEMVVLAVDGSRKVSEAALVIDVLNVNDLAPRYEKEEYFVRVSEEMEVGDTVMELVASDGDIRENSEK